MKKYTLTPYIRMAWDNTFERLDRQIGPRVIFDYEIIFLYSGEIDLTLEGKHYQVLPGDFIILRPMQRHTLRSVGSELVHQSYIHFDLQEDELSSDIYVSYKDYKAIPPSDYRLFREDILEEICPDIPPVLRFKNYKRMRNILMAIIHEKEKRMVYSDMQANGLFLQLFSLLLREISLDNEDSNDVGYEDIAWKAQKYLNDNLNQSISLDKLAEQIHVSKYYLSHRFRQAFGVSPIQYHLDSRLEHAKYLLGTTKLPIGEIAEQVGFPNIYSFSRAFKKKEKVSPSVYRQE